MLQQAVISDLQRNEIENERIFFRKSGDHVNLKVRFKTFCPYIHTLVSNFKLIIL